MRLIDADKLVKTFCSHCVDHDECKSECMDLKIIKSMKTVDAEPTIRCKDCKYWDYDTDVGFCTRTEDCDWSADDFCSRGERAE